MKCDIFAMTATNGQPAVFLSQTDQFGIDMVKRLPKQCDRLRQAAGRYRFHRILDGIPGLLCSDGLTNMIDLYTSDMPPAPALASTSYLSATKFPTSNIFSPHQKTDLR